MKPTFKPYRLINDHELTMLQTTFENNLQQWNAKHAMYPLTCRLGLGPTKPPHLKGNHLSVIKQSVFGDNSNCFNPMAETLFLELSNQLLGTKYSPPLDDWFYIGTPSLTLTLYCSDKTMPLYLDPQWVLNALPSTKIPGKPVLTLHQALATQRINLDIELTSLSLKLSDVIRLNVGDVIKTDHPITKPAQLSHQQIHVCAVDIGESKSFKSIQITRET